MNWTVLQSWWVNLFGRLLEGLFVATFALELMWVLRIFILWLFLDLYLMLLECLLVNRGSFKGYFLFTINVTLNIRDTWSCIHKVGIFLCHKVCLVTALPLELWFIWLVYICRLLFHYDGFGLVTIFVWSFWVEGDFWFSG